jgi:hypothetical protein
MHKLPSPSNNDRGTLEGKRQRPSIHIRSYEFENGFGHRVDGKGFSKISETNFILIWRKTDHNL